MTCQCSIDIASFIAAAPAAAAAVTSVPTNAAPAPADFFMIAFHTKAPLDEMWVLTRFGGL